MVPPIINLFEISDGAKNILSLFLLITLIISLWRQLFGFKDLGYLTTIILAFFLTHPSWLSRLFFVLLVLFYVAMANIVLKRIVILRFPKDTLFIIFTTLLVLVTLNILSLPFGPNNNPLVSPTETKLDMFVMLSLVVLVLKFKQILNDKPYLQIANIFTQGMIPVFLTIFLFNWSKLQLFIHAYFGLFLVVMLVALVFVGKYGGLRLSEVIKYYKILKQEE